MLPSIFGENLFDDFFDDFGEFDRMMNRFNRETGKALYGRKARNLMKTDVRDTGDGYELDVDLPGFKKDEVSVKLNDGYLTISAAKGLDKDDKDKKGNYIRRERYAGAMQRSFYVGDIKGEDIRARFENGILSLTVPKAEVKKLESTTRLQSNKRKREPRRETGAVFLFPRALRGAGGDGCERGEVQPHGPGQELGGEAGVFIIRGAEYAEHADACEAPCEGYERGQCQPAYHEAGAALYQKAERAAEAEIEPEQRQRAPKREVQQRPEQPDAQQHGPDYHARARAAYRYGRRRLRRGRPEARELVERDAEEAGQLHQPIKLRHACAHTRSRVDWRETPSAAASSSCFMPRAARRAEIFSPRVM